MKKPEIEETSDWNMGVHYYMQLAFLKEQYMNYYMMGDVRKACKALSLEINWVNLDLGEQNLKRFRSIIKSLRMQSQTNLSDRGKNMLLNQLEILQEQVWDLENKNNITRPKNNVDYTNVRMAALE